MCRWAHNIWERTSWKKSSRLVATRLDTPGMETGKNYTTQIPHLHSKISDTGLSKGHRPTVMLHYNMSSNAGWMVPANQPSGRPSWATFWFGWHPALLNLPYRMQYFWRCWRKSICALYEQTPVIIKNKSVHYLTTILLNYKTVSNR